MSLINLDSSFFDKETDRVKTNQLAQFIKKIDTQILDSKLFFVDYQYKSEIDKDSILYKALSNIQRRLILPHSLDVNGKIAIRGKGSQLTKTDVQIKRKLEVPALAYGLSLIHI